MKVKSVLLEEGQVRAHFNDEIRWIVMAANIELFSLVALLMGFAQGELTNAPRISQPGASVALP